MSATEKTVSALINTQLPEFIKADSPQFKRFIELYYDWLERDGDFTVGANTYAYGNTVYHIENIEKYRDVDETLDPFVRLFKEELLPHFPETTELDLTKILKGAREFYVKKGSEESVKWLFRVLFNQDVEVYYPKQQILIASDGKWKLPQAFQLTLSDANYGIIPNLLEKHKGIGSESTATCIIESADRTIDSTFGNEILEIYVSNVTKAFVNGENLEILYTDENGIEQLFSEKIIGAISGIKIDSQIKTDPQQKRRGLSYNVGDPVIVYGGLDVTAQANDAVAVVGNVTVGSIEALAVTFPGYGFRSYWNTEAIVYRSVGDDPNANQSTDIRVGAYKVDVNANSQFNYSEYINVDLLPTTYLDGVVLSTADYTVFTQNNRNIIINATEISSTVKYNNYEDVYANGSSYATANFKGKILTSNSTGFCQGGAAYTGVLALYSVSNTVPLTTTGFLTGQPIYSANTLKQFTTNSLTSAQVAANINSQIIQALNFQSIETGGVSLFNVLNGGYGFRATPTVTTTSYYDTYLSMGYDYINNHADKVTWRQPMGAFGQIAHVYVDNPGKGYANGDIIVVGDRGYGFSGYVNVNTTGSIMWTTITNRGEGYFGNKTVRVTSSAGTNASLSAYGFGEGLETVVSTGAIGRVSDVRMKSRGFDYISAPVVSFKVVDMVINAIGESQSLSEGEKVYQGASLLTATFAGTVKNYNRTTNTLRLFNFSGASYGLFNNSLPFTSEGGVVFTIDTTKKVIAPVEYPTTVQASGLPNPWFYGNGKARGYAEFFNGLIKYPGFFLNTDGFLSADKKTQDGKTYHNYSYIIESEKSLSDYQDSMNDIVHPIGMSMLARAIAKSEIVEQIKSNSEVAMVLSTTPVNTNVSASSYDTLGRAYLRGTMAPSANVGDMIRIGNRTLKQITAIANTNTTPSLSIDFTANTYDLFPANTTILTLESNTAFVGDGRIRTTNNSNTLSVSGNSDSLLNTLVVGDELRFNIADYRTNLVTYSQDFNHATWSLTNLTVGTNALSAPDGTVTADKLQEVGGTVFVGIQKTISLPTSTSRYYTATFYAKAGERNYAQIRIQSNPTTTAYSQGAYDLLSGQSYANVTGGATSAVASMENVGNGWWRCSLTCLIGNAETSVLYYILPNNTFAGSASYATTAGYGIYVWGAQLEAASSPNGYIPTAAIAVKSNTGSNVIYTSNVVAISGNTIQVNTFQHLITSNSTNRVYKVFPAYINTTYQIITSAP